MSILNCSSDSRREFLQLVSGGGLSFLLPAMSVRASERRGDERPTSLITVWLQGGPSQLETWDPHPGTAIGGPTQAIETSLSGVRIAEHYPQVAEQLEHLSVIRSLTSKEGDHERGSYFLKTGYRPDPTLTHPSLGAILTKYLPNENLEIPAHVSLGGGQWPPRGGYLSARFDAFKVFDPGGRMPHIKAQVQTARQDKRLAGLEAVNRTFQLGRPGQEDRTLHSSTMKRALDMMTSQQLKAFEIDEEPDVTRQAYGDSRFGRGCLVARRLVEVGVRAVEVTLTGFDSHADNFDAHIARANDLDPALAQLVKDLRARDLWDSTIILCIGEFGRTPKINPLDGRDHWPNGFSCLIGGGGLAAGQVIGETDPEGIKPPQDPIKVANLHATILTRFGLNPAEELYTPINRPLALSDGEVIERLLQG
ncbi:DUF1501 domain-containing protein [Calycomorphotria hydatis]|nr:DUF1501 domain-containing protein [Calycomorphotria hydatis]